MNLFASLKEALTEGLIGQIAALNDEKPEKIQKAFDALGASIVGGLIKRVTTESGMKLVFNQVQKIEFEPGQLSKIFKNQAELDALKAVGEKDLNTVLPGLKSSVSSMVAKYAGTRNSLASSLCGVAVAIVMSVLKRKVSEKNLDTESLAAYLGDQREGLLNTVPEINDKLIESIGIQYLLQNFSVPRTEHSGALPKGVEGAPASKPFLVGVDMEQSQTDYRPYLKWIGIGVLVIGVIAAGVYFWNQRQADTSDSDSDSTVTEARTIQEPIAKDTTTKEIQAAATPTTTTASPMATYLDDSAAQKGKSFKFDNVDFEDNTAQLKTASNDAVQALADLLKKYPNAQIKLVGYANDAQPPLTNKTLSVKRVFTLKDMFVKAGISYVRVDAEGRGTGINPKDTTGRKQTAMREVWVKFVQK
jgi:outer membrane protein OmpA-like peptidoglycan-associated protein